MTRFLILMFLFTVCASADAQDSVDVINSKFEILSSEGLEKLYTRQIAELAKIKESALTDKDLDLANKANASIDALHLRITDLLANRPKEVAKEASFPENEFYRMISCNNKLGTEHGKEIICRFERKPLNQFSGDKLVLTLQSNPSKDSGTAHQVFVRNGSGGAEIAMIGSLPQGATREVPLSIPPSEVHEIVVVVKGRDALHLKPHLDLIPELYLSMKR